MEWSGVIFFPSSPSPSNRKPIQLKQAINLPAYKMIVYKITVLSLKVNVKLITIKSEETLASLAFEETCCISRQLVKPIFL